MFQKKTIRCMKPKTKKLALLCNDVEKTYRRLKKQVEVMAELESTYEAFWNKKKHDQVKQEDIPEEMQKQILSKGTKGLF